MTVPSRTLIALCFVLAPTVASAQEPRLDPGWKTRAERDLEQFQRTGDRAEPGEPPCYPENPNRAHSTRHLILYQDAADKVLEVYVSGGVVTILRLPAKLATRGTGIAPGGERRFDLLMRGEVVVIIPTRQLAKGERFPMVVALADGTVIPLSLTRAPENGRTDGELWLEREQASPEQLRIRLASMTEKAKGFETSLRQALKEQESADFQLAGLMASNQSKLTAFERARVRELMASAGRRVKLTTYAPRPDAENATSKVVAVFEITNKGPEPLDLSSGTATRHPGADFVPVALRAQPSVIPPGGQGSLAVVLDRASFGSGEIVSLAFFDKHLNVGIQLSADLTLEDFTAPPRSGFSWPF